MRVFSALVWREVLERRLLLVASFVLGLVPVLAPWVPGSPERFAPEDIRTVGVLTLLVLFGGATLLILGSTILVRDLSEGRLSFFFSRPIPVWALWLSRITAACLLLFASLLLMSIPTAIIDFQAWVEQLTTRSSSRAWPFLGFHEMFMLSGGRQVLPVMPPAWFRLALLTTAILSLLALAHVVATAVRARSLWVLGDLTGLAIVAAVGWSARDVLVREEALGALLRAEWLLLPWVLACLLVAGARQLSRGRTDLQLGHRVLSMTLWPLLLVGALAFGGYARWVAASEIDDLESMIYVETSADERWLVAGGPVRQRARAQAAFLRHAESDRSWRLGSLGVTRAYLTFSGDSSLLAWVRCESFRPMTCRVWAKDLRQVASPPEATSVPWDRLPRQMVLSRDGRRIAFAESRRIVIYEVASGRLVAAVDASQPFQLSFLSGDLIRFQEPVDDGTSRSLRIRHFDLDSLRIVDAGRFPSGHTAWLDPHGDAVRYGAPTATGFGLFDGATGQQLAELDEHWRLARKSTKFLADGRLVLAVIDDLDLQLAVFSREGLELLRMDWPRVLRVAFGGELSPGRMLVALLEVPMEKPPPSGAKGDFGVEPLLGWTTYALDVETAELTPLAAGMLPLIRDSVAEGPRLFASRSAVLWWDPRSDDHKVLLEPENGLWPKSRMGEIYVSARVSF